MKFTTAFFVMLLLVVVMSLGPGAASANAAEVFKCKDENGKIKYQSQPCENKAEQEKLKLQRGPVSDDNTDEEGDDSASSDSETPELDRMIANEEDERIKQQLQIRKQQCELARRNLEAYEKANLLTARNDDGTTRQLSAEEAAAEKQKARDFLQGNCK